MSNPNPKYIGTDRKSTLDLQTYHNEALADIEKALAEGRNISTPEKEKARNKILEMATNDNNTCGKWLLRSSPADVDETWNIVANLVSKLLYCVNNIVLLILV